jgi:hypothetical protein
MRNLLIVLFLVSHLVLSSQPNGDCVAAFNICSGSFTINSSSGSGSFADFSTTTTISNPQNNPVAIIPPGGSGCLLSGESNTIWMIINIQNSGSLEFSIADGAGVQLGCYDWIMWPYSVNTCSMIPGNSLGPVRCCWNSVCSGGTGIASNTNLPSGASQQNYCAPLSVTCGDQFILCMNNYSNITATVPVTFFGTASVSCTFSPCITSIDKTSEGKNIGIFPNPSLGKYKIEIEGVNAPCFIEVFDALGTIIKRQQFDKSDPFLDISDQPKGVYFIRVSSGGKEIFRDKLILH